MLNLKKVKIKNDSIYKTILEEINLKLNNSEVVGVIGVSGAGKTTLLNTIALGIKINSGDIIFDENTINLKSKKNKNKYRKNIGIISQKNSLINEISVYENLKIIMSERNNIFFKIFNIITKDQKYEIHKILERLGLLNKIFYSINDLSGGELQRIEIAKLIIKKPKIILADEPTSNLDKNNAKNIIKWLKEITIQNNTITIIVIHDIELLKKNFDRVIGIKNKKIYLDKKSSLITKKDIETIYGK